MKLTSGLLLESREFIIRLCNKTSNQIEVEFEGIHPLDRIIPFLNSIDLFVEQQSFNHLFASLNRQDTLKEILFYFCIKQDFIKQAKRGRNHIKSLLDSDTNNCFEQANLFDQSLDTDNWWHRIFSYSRSIQEEKKNDTGYKGEINSYNFERSRVNQYPKKEFIDNTTVGYDLLSWVNASSDDRLRIEVKSTNSSIGSALAYISKKEYSTAMNEDGNHCFHFWLLGESPPKLAVLEKNLITDLAPKEMSKDFQLEQYTVKFRHFKDYFSDINFS